MQDEETKEEQKRERQRQRQIQGNIKVTRKIDITKKGNSKRKNTHGSVRDVMRVIRFVHVSHATQFNSIGAASVGSTVMNEQEKKLCAETLHHGRTFHTLCYVPSMHIAHGTLTVTVK